MAPMMLTLLVLSGCVATLTAAEELPRATAKKDMECPELRSKRYISDGLCSSAYPIHEVVCADSWTSRRLRQKSHRCVDGVSKRRRVELLCQDGSRRFYQVRVVKSCRRQDGGRLPAKKRQR